MSLRVVGAALAGAGLLLLSGCGGGPSPILLGGGGPQLPNIPPFGFLLIQTQGPPASISSVPFSILGTLDSTAGAAVTAGPSPGAMTISQNLQFPELFVLSPGEKSVYGYAINTVGALSPLNGSPFPVGDNPTALVAGGSCLYVLNAGDNSVTSFTIGPSGNLSPAGEPVAVASGAQALALTQNGSVLDVISAGGPGEAGSVAVYSVGFSSCFATPTSDSYAVGGTPVAGFDFQSSSLGELFFVANHADSTVSAFSVGVFGVLTPLPGSPFPAPPQPTMLAASTFLGPDEILVAGDGGQLSGYILSPTGAWTPAPGDPYGIGGPAGSLAIVAGVGFVTAKGGNQLLGFTENFSTGALIPANPISLSGTASGLAAVMASDF